MSVIQFNQLSEAERNLLYNSPALVTCLIGDADGNLNEAERKQSEHFVKIHTESGDAILFDFYKHVALNHQVRIDEIENKFEYLSATEKEESIIAELAKLNEILPKVDNLYARVFIKSLRALGKIVAESTGGIGGFFEISYDEERLLGLDMITYQP